ncbi:hypothetical protein CFP56_013591 [Quercus suber]|uniref:Uncharacterized protein n=1 Tax=Quercus suber TaxID=58331 RepID=A0AAW0KVB3_QUESU
MGLLLRMRAIKGLLCKFVIFNMLEEKVISWLMP